MMRYDSLGQVKGADVNIDMGTGSSSFHSSNYSRRKTDGRMFSRHTRRRVGYGFGYFIGLCFAVACGVLFAGFLTRWLEVDAGKQHHHHYQPYDIVIHHHQKPKSNKETNHHPHSNGHKKRSQVIHHAHVTHHNRVLVTVSDELQATNSDGIVSNDTYSPSRIPIRNVSSTTEPMFTTEVILASSTETVTELDYEIDLDIILITVYLVIILISCVLYLLYCILEKRLTVSRVQIEFPNVELGTGIRPESERNSIGRRRQSSATTYTPTLLPLIEEGILDEPTTTAHPATEAV